MSRLFLITFDLPEDKEALLGFLDVQTDVTDWHTSMSNTVFVETTLALKDLREILRKAPISSFIAIEIRPDEYRQTLTGWLPRATWEFIARKVVSGH